MPIIREDFALDCADQALFFGVNPHFLVGVAELLSGINDDADGDKIGPFRITQAEWDEKGKDPAFQLNLKPDQIRRPGMQCIFAALMTFRAQKLLLEKLDRFPTPDELYTEWPNAKVPDGKSLKDSLAKTADLIESAVKAALEGLDAEGLLDGIKLDSIPSSKHDTARLIVRAFADAGYGKLQQAAGLANAIAESNLNPNAVHITPKEHSVGLFQLNINGGVGEGHDEDELKNPVRNTELIIATAKKRAPKFKKATSLHEAVAIFVTKVEQPANSAGEIIKRLAIADKLIA